MTKFHLHQSLRLASSLAIAAIILSAPAFSVVEAHATDNGEVAVNNSSENIAELITRIKEIPDYQKMKQIYDVVSCGKGAGSAPGWFFSCHADTEEGQAKLQKVVEEVYPQILVEYKQAQAANSELSLAWFINDSAIYNAWMQICWGINSPHATDVDRNNFVRNGLLVLQAETFPGKTVRLWGKVDQTEIIKLIKTYDNTEWLNDGSEYLQGYSYTDETTGKLVYLWDILTPEMQQQAANMNAEEALNLVKTTNAYQTNAACRELVDDNVKNIQQYYINHLQAALGNFVDEDLMGKTLRELQAITRDLEEYDAGRALYEAANSFWTGISSMVDGVERYGSIAGLPALFLEETKTPAEQEEIYQNLVTKAQALYPDILDGLYDYKLVLAEKMQPALPSLPEAGSLADAEQSATVIKIALSGIATVITVVGLGLIIKRFRFSPLKRRK